jgi:hypothetical protein
LRKVEKEDVSARVWKMCRERPEVSKTLLGVVHQCLFSILDAETAYSTPKEPLSTTKTDGRGPTIGSRGQTTLHFETAAFGSGTGKKSCEEKENEKLARRRVTSAHSEHAGKSVVKSF